MRCGLFGKLQAKRDFIAMQVPRAFLNAWEPWLQSAIAASRVQLDRNWQTAFLTAPIWRFWLGADLCGQNVVGALMPSMDGIGRYFPLALIAYGEDGECTPPPELDAHDSWFAAVEDFLFGTLEDGVAFEQTMEKLAVLPLPETRGSESGATIETLRAGAVLLRIGEQAFPAAFGTLRDADFARAHAGRSFWWTLGGEGYGRAALATTGLPDPFLFAGMLTGDFAVETAVPQ